MKTTLTLQNIHKEIVKLIHMNSYGLLKHKSYESIALYDEQI